MDLTLEDIHGKMRSYLAGEIDVDDFNDWCDDQPRVAMLERATKVQIGPHSWRTVAYANPADDLFSEISLMFCEMYCSGCYLKEPEFRQRIQDLLDGAPCSEPARTPAAWHPRRTLRLRVFTLLNSWRGCFRRKWQHDRDNSTTSPAQRTRYRVK